MTFMERGAYSRSTRAKKSHAMSSYKKQKQKNPDKPQNSQRVHGCPQQHHLMQMLKQAIGDEFYAYPFRAPHITPSVVVVTLPLLHLKATFAILCHVATTARSVPLVLRSRGTDGCYCDTDRGWGLDFVSQFVHHLFLLTCDSLRELWNISLPSSIHCLK